MIANSAAKFETRAGYDAEMGASRQHATFDEFVAAKTRAATTAPIEHLGTISETHDDRLRYVGNPWTREFFDGDFGIIRETDGAPALSLVFVQSRDGNTVADNPADLGGGPTDEHLIYEGLTRVAVDGVIAGASTIGPNTFFSVWHPELIALRRALGLPRHPAQIVISNDGRVNYDAWLFNVPDVPVFLLAGVQCRTRCAAAFAARPWLHIVPLTPNQLARDVTDVAATHGLRRFSVVGGRFTASRLVDAGLVQDLYLTTTPCSAGKSNTPWYDGQQRPATRIVSRKQWLMSDGARTFEHALVASRDARSDF